MTLSFDDGFRKSSLATAALFEKFGLKACLNVIATGHRPDFVTPDSGQKGVEKGDFGLWNELAARGHEIMPHGYRHANKAQMPLTEAQDLIRRCLDVFQRELKGFVAKKSVFNFPYNSSTPPLESWLAGEVRAFRTGGKAINPPPSEATSKLTCVSFGPGNAEADLDARLHELLGQPEGWLIYNLHGLDGEGWGPVRSGYLSKLLERLSGLKGLRVLPAGAALEAAAASKN